MKMTKWRLGFYCFCLMAIGLASNAVNTIPQSKTRKIASRTIASNNTEVVVGAIEHTDTKIAVDRAAVEEVLIVTPTATIYKRTRYVERVRVQVKTQKALLAKINDKSAEIEKKNQEIKRLKQQSGIKTAIIAIAAQEIKELEAEKAKLKTDFEAVKRAHAQERESLKADIASLQSDLGKTKAERDEEIKLKEQALVSLKSESEAKKEEIRLKEEALKKLSESEATTAEEIRLKLVALEALKAETLDKEREILLKEEALEELRLTRESLTEETKLKEEALASLLQTQKEFSDLQVELTSTEEKLTAAGEEITRLEGVVAELQKSIETKEATIAERDAHIKDQGTQLADLRIAECEQRKQLESLQEQVKTFETEKEELDKVVAALKEEKEKMAEERKKEKKEIAALMQQFTMYATLMGQMPQPQMPMIDTNPLSNSSLVDWNQYMALAMMNNVMSRPGSSPFDFNGGNTQVNSYYYMPKQATDAYLYHSALNPQGTHWGEIGPDSYFGSMGQGFDFNQTQAYGMRNPASRGGLYAF